MSRARHVPYWSVACGLGLALVTAGCASALPKEHYEMHSLDFEGVDAMSDDALRACLASQPRDAVTLRLGLGAPKCGEPPFDASAPSVDLWTWPWEPRQVYDPAIFAIDRKRIERWYAARGYFEARVVDVEYHVDGTRIERPERCETDDCDLDVRVLVEEGKPVLVSDVELEITAPVARKLAEQLHDAIEVRVDTRFDESAYKADEARMMERLTEASYARAAVTTRVEVDRVARTARIEYRVEPGPWCTLGESRVEGADAISSEAVLDVAGLRPGTPYRASELREAERAVYALGVFASVRIEPTFERAPDVADLVIRVQSARLERLRLGIGMMSGSLQRTASDELQSVPEWDFHLRGIYENRNFLGGMRKLRLEDRPRLIFLAPFPYTRGRDPRLGNTLSLELEQPRFPERRTTAFLTNTWDIGPDPYYGFFRHDLATRIGVRRTYFGDRLALELAVQHDLYEITSSSQPDTVSSYRLPFLEQQAKLDLRDDALRPTGGAYFSTTAQEAARVFGYGSWDYLRLLGEARAYQRLFWKVVLAARLTLGAIFVEARDEALDPTSAQLGPQSYRLRGGGANGNRGFGPGRLGAGIEGGKRRWESSIELRVPLGADVSFVVFLDGGDVSRTATLHFDRPHAATGFGVRYYTPFAPIRFDAGWRIPGIQRLDGTDEAANTRVWPSAAHLTIGEAF